MSSSSSSSSSGVEKRKATDEPDSSSPSQRQRIFNSPIVEKIIALLDEAQDKFEKLPPKVRLSTPLGEWTPKCINGTTDKDFSLREFLGAYLPEVYGEFSPIGKDYDFTVCVGDWGEFLRELKKFKQFVLDCDERLKPCEALDNLFEDACKVAEQFRYSLSPFDKILNMDPAALRAATIGTFDHLVELTHPTTIGFPVLHPAVPTSSSDVDGGLELSRFCDVDFKRTGKREGKFGWKIFLNQKVIFKILDDGNMMCDVWISREEDYRAINFKSFGSFLMYADDLSGVEDKPYSDFISLRFNRNGTFAVALGV